MMYTICAYKAKLFDFLFFPRAFRRDVNTNALTHITSHISDFIKHSNTFSLPPCLLRYPYAGVWATTISIYVRKRPNGIFFIYFFYYYYYYYYYFGSSLAKYSRGTFAVHSYIRRGEYIHILHVSTRRKLRPDCSR
jgi:hypothetical protein